MKVKTKETKTNKRKETKLDNIICVGIGENEEESKKIKEATEKKINNWLEMYKKGDVPETDDELYPTNVTDFDQMSKKEKLEYISERDGKIIDGIGVNSEGHEFRDDEGSALFI